MALEDIRAMTYTKNPSCVEILDLEKIPCLKLSRNRTKWTYESSKRIPVGQAHARFNLYGRIKQGVIGVYDLNKPEHLERMLIDAEEATN